MRVYAVVEGASEERFLKDQLAPELALHQVYLTPMQVLRKGGKGGGSKWEPWKRHLQRLLSQHAGNDVRVTTMLDLYGIPRNVPGYTEPGSAPGAQRAKAILDALVTDLADPRFVPYIQVHEFEAFLFAQLDTLRQEAPDIVAKQNDFTKLVEETAGQEPESINDDPNTAPSRRIGQCTQGFRKTIHGLQALKRIGLTTLRERCPRFGAWYEALESLGEPFP